MMIRFALLLLLILNVTLSFAQKSTDWHLAYWMPYANNLAAWSDSIVSMIVSKISDEISVSVQLDRLDSGGMERFRISSQGVTDLEKLESDTSLRVALNLKFI